MVPLESTATSSSLLTTATESSVSAAASYSSIMSAGPAATSMNVNHESSSTTTVGAGAPVADVDEGVSPSTSSSSSSLSPSQQQRPCATATEVANGSFPSSTLSTSPPIIMKPQHHDHHHHHSSSDSNSQPAEHAIPNVSEEIMGISRSPSPFEGSSSGYSGAVKISVVSPMSSSASTTSPTPEQLSPKSQDTTLLNVQHQKQQQQQYYSPGTTVTVETKAATTTATTTPTSTFVSSSSHCGSSSSCSSSSSSSTSPSRSSLDIEHSGRNNTGGGGERDANTRRIGSNKHSLDGRRKKNKNGRVGGSDSSTYCTSSSRTSNLSNNNGSSGRRRSIGSHHSNEHSQINKSSSISASASVSISACANKKNHGVVVSSYSNLATRSIGEGNYGQAFEYYKLALCDYLNDGRQIDDIDEFLARNYNGGGGGGDYHHHDIFHRLKHQPGVGTTSIVELVNAAATCFNLGALSKKLSDYESSASYFRRAQEMYQRSVVLVDGHRSHNMMTTVTAATSSVTSNGSTKNTALSSQSYSCEVCLLQLLVETLQARAHLHYKYQSRIDDAIECHEQVIDLLDDNDVDGNGDSDSDTEDDDEGRITPRQQVTSQRRRKLRRLQCDTVYSKIHFTVLPEGAQLKLLATSLQALGKFYVERGNLEEALSTYDEALTVLENIEELCFESNKERREEIERIIEALSDVYDQSILKARSSMSSPEDEEDVTELERLAFVQEDMENWEEAIQCWERVLLHVSNRYGEHSRQVADVLVQMSRCMVLDDNLEGALDVCHFSSNIFLREENRTVGGETTTICALPEALYVQILQLYLDLDQRADAIPWLKMLLTKCEGNLTEEAKVRFEIAGIYLDLGYTQAAHDELCKSYELCHDGNTDDRTHELLQRIESMRQSIKFPSTEETDPSLLTAIAEEGESKLTLTEDGESRLTGLSDDIFDIDATKSLSMILGKDEESAPDDVNFFESKASYHLVEDAMAIEAARLDALVSQASHTMINDRPSSEQVETISKHLSKSALSSSLEIPETLPVKSRCFKTFDRSNSAMSHPTDEGAPEYLQSDNNLPRVTATVPTTKEDVEQDAEQELQGISASSEHQQLSRDANALDSDEDASYDADDDGEDDEGYESFKEKNRSVDETKDVSSEAYRSPLLLIKRPGSETASPTTPNSTTGLLLDSKKENAPAADEKPLHLPNLRSPRQSKSRSRKGYTEVPERKNEEVQRRTFVQALASPFWRSRSKTKPTGLNTLDEDNEVFGSIPKKSMNTFDEDSVHSTDAPVSVIDADGMSVVSQITVRMEEFNPNARFVPIKKDDQQWWWGEELEGWFPSDYVNKALEAAEGFLSAKAIHVKSRPLEFFSDDESEGGEDFSLLRESSSKLSKGHVSSSHTSKLSERDNKNKARQETSSGPKESISRGESGSLKSNAFTSQKSSETKKHLSLESVIIETESVLETLKAERGAQDVGVAVVLFQLAKLYQKKGDTVSAIQLGREALEIQKAVSDVTAVCQTLYLVADLHIESKEFNKAMSCYSDARKILEDKHGRYCEEVADTLNRIGNLWTEQEEYESAMESHKQALLVLKECCGEDISHPRVSQTLILIGDVYYKERNSLATIQSKTDGYSSFIEHGMLEVIARCHEQRGSYGTAIKFFLERLQFLKEEDSSDDSSDNLEEVVETLNSLAMLSCRAGQYLEAIDYYDRALGIQMKMGCDDAQLATAKVLAGSVEYHLGLYSKALDLFEDALATLLEEVGEQETVAATLFHIHFIYAARCDYVTAMSNLQNALKIQLKLLGPNHPATLRTRREIANVLIEEGRGEVEKEFLDIIECQKKIHGENHPNIADTLHSLARSHVQKGSLQEAHRTFQEAYNMRLPFLGAEHPHQATTLLEIAKIQQKRGTKKSVQRAIRFVESALSIREESLPEQHIDVALAKAMKGSCLVSAGLYSEAKKLISDSLRIARASVGETHPSVAWIHLQAGIMYDRQCRFEESKKSIETAIEIYRSFYPTTEDDDGTNHDEHPSIKDALHELERVERAELLCV